MTDSPEITFPAELPVAAHADEIAALIRDNQVVIVAGETGSGKTTQLPKICLRLGRRSIAHTQPRRIAARTVAARIAHELGVALGSLVGYQVRFTRQASSRTRVKVMTDGILLAELGRDKDLRAYDTIIVDEAHERSLNIDFLLGYLKQLLRRRPELKVIVTSATIDTQRFSQHFDNAPVIEVSGRTYPVEVRYRPLGEVDQTDGIVEAVTELVTEPMGGDVLVFCSGEREIRDAADALAGADLGLEIMPLYARLSAAEQQRVFEPHGTRRVVIATNVAETSITVPGIRSVVDAGTARISRYSARTKVQRLPIEPISQASANQRAGRCGRIGPGIAIRLYSEEDYLSRPEFTDPEILRTNLAMVILQMAQAGLGDIASFPFVEPPPSSQITDGLRLLDELGALAGGRRGHVRLTPIGRRLAALPVDPRLGRMLLEGAARGCLRELLVLVSALAIPDVRERPAEKAEAADALHRRFWTDAGAAPTPQDDQPRRHTVHTGTRPEEAPPSDGAGDIGAILRLWDYLRSRRRALSGNAFRRMCRDEFLNFLRVREWEDLHSQLKQVTRELELPRNSAPAPVSEVLTSVLSGLLSHVGLAEVTEAPRQRGRRRPLREYLGARGSRFAIQPGSALARTTPPLVMAVELVETSRLWARTVAAVNADQIEAVGGHVLHSTLSEPHWSQRSGRVQASERVTLFGVPIIAGRTVDFSSRDPVAAREIFIRRALVEGEWTTRHPFFAANQKLRAQVEELEDRTRRRDLIVDDQAIYDFYAARLPDDVVSTATFDRWWRRLPDKGLLDLTMDDLVTGDVDAGGFPDRWRVGQAEVPVTYVFEPGTGHDGVNVRVPMTLLNQLDPAAFTWQVPGLRQELATELIRTLPKSLRTNFVPAPEYAARALAWLRAHPSSDEAFPVALGRALRALTGESVAVDAWRPEGVPAHLQVTFTITDGGGEVGKGNDLDALREKLTPRLNQALTTASEKSVSGATSWVFGDIPERTQVGRGARRVVGYPTLVDEGRSVGLQLVDTPERASRMHAAGVRRLLVLTNPDPVRWVVSHLSNPDKLALGSSPYPTVPDLLADARLKAVDQLARRVGIDVRTPEAYKRLADAVRVDTADRALQVTRVVSRILASRSRISVALAAWPPDSPLRRDVTEQLANLTFASFISATPDPWFDRLPVYLEAIEARLAAARTNPTRDAQQQAQIDDIEADYADLVNAQPAGPLSQPVEEIGFLIEELRISLFAQQLRTSVPVSSKRIRQQIAAVR